MSNARKQSTRLHSITKYNAICPGCGSRYTQANRIDDHIEIWRCKKCFVSVPQRVEIRRLAGLGFSYQEISGEVDASIEVVGEIVRGMKCGE